MLSCEVHCCVITQGHYVRNLGDIGDKDTENQVLLLEHNIPHARFSEDVLACLPQMPWAISEAVGQRLHFLLD